MSTGRIQRRAVGVSPLIRARIDRSPEDPLEPASGVNPLIVTIVQSARPDHSPTSKGAALDERSLFVET